MGGAEYMDYNTLLNQWADKIYKEADEAMQRYEDSNKFDFKSGYQKGYSDGLRMAISILTRMEQLNASELKGADSGYPCNDKGCTVEVYRNLE